MADSTTPRVLTSEEALACEVVALVGQLRDALDQLGERAADVAALKARIATWEAQTRQRVDQAARSAVLAKRYALPSSFRYETDDQGVVHLTDTTPPPAATAAPAAPPRRNGEARGARDELLAAVAASRTDAGR